MALVEASWKLGDRSLYLTSPNLRGDDVADLQVRLARLGFDCGRVDGILGPRTARAIDDFQHNCGLVADAVCGPKTVQALLRVSGQTGDGPGVAVVRERERLRQGWGSVAHSRVVIGQFGGLSVLSRSITKELRGVGATVMSLDEPDAVAQALAANHFDATVYVGFEASAEPGITTHFYKVASFESLGGHTLADLLSDQLHEVLPDVPATTVGMRMPVLRETRMPAVLITLGPIRQVADQAAALATAVVHSLQLWTSRAS